MSDWSRYLIRTERSDIYEMLACWEWLVGRDKHPLVMTKFGDWFLVDSAGMVHWLDLLEGTCQPFANTVDEFQQKVCEPEQIDLWFLGAWCDTLHASGLIPSEDECYGFKIPPKLGAPVELENVEVANLMAYQLWMAEIAKIPPGTTVDSITVTGNKN